MRDRDYRQQVNERSGARLARGADGKLRAVGRAERVAGGQSKSKPEQQAKQLAERRELAFQFTLPRVKLPAFKKRVIWMGALGLFVIIGVTVTVFAIFSQKNDKKNPTNPASVLNEQDQKPSYNTVLPDNKSIDDLGGWQRISPDDRDPVFAYVDSIDGVQINVSQQELPQSFKEDTAGSVKKLAEQFSANQEVPVEDLVVYLGNSTKGPQSVVFARDNLLILIKSSGKLNNRQWGEYISSLR